MALVTVTEARGRRLSVAAHDAVAEALDYALDYALDEPLELAAPER